jgi:mercuric ion transport protein
MIKSPILLTGVVGTVVAVVCCFTPILVVLLSLVGLSALTGYLDYVLLPALAVFLGLTAYGLVRQKQAGGPSCCEAQPRSPDHG